MKVLYRQLLKCANTVVPIEEGGGFIAGWKGAYTFTAIIIQGVSFVKLKIRRTDIERILILCAAALVVVLALRGGTQQTSQILYEDQPLDVTQTAVTNQGDTQATVVYYQDGEGYLVPVTR
jgi:hypothetical protein